ncbi:MAG: YajQ family cyclic di-GMP-binding protein [Chloroflexi bacterium]|nr:MAG: YajQ family cyclic di-GMP-binding protein [Chloroflexota bacterium]RLT33609.1 MAG: YajQ family cyclic di-GMP-binding protein [Chloroflexota bacterium]
MPAESSFDIVSEYDAQEMVNAVDQTKREVQTRYDLKDTKTDIELSEKELIITTETEMHMTAIRDILLSKALRRNLSIKVFKMNDVQDVAGGRVKQVITLQKGLADDVAKKIQRFLKDKFPKVQGRIQGESIRVGSKSRDDLQLVISALREASDEFPVALQFNNYR